MQWDKVKNILIVVLLLVDGFLGFTVFGRYWDTYRQQQAFAADLSVILARDGVEYAVTGSTPTQSRIMPLEADRSRTAEEQFARALLTGEVRLETEESGGVTFTGSNGTVSWQADGAVRASLQLETVAAGTENQLRARAEALLQQAGVSLRGGTWTVDSSRASATLTATVDGFPVFDRSLTVEFPAEDMAAVYGKWSFEQPYAGTGEEKRVCNVADALIYLAEQPSVRRIDHVKLGYRMQPGASGRYQFAPSWRIETDDGVWFVDALKKNAEHAEKIVK